ncbi:hypothetical protein ACTMU2_29345 [Cupriavidus basilensis]
MSTTLAAGSTPADHVAVACSAMNPYGVTQELHTLDLPKNPLPRGQSHVWHGSRLHALDCADSASCLEYSGRQGDHDSRDLRTCLAEVPVITSATGMIGMPEQTQNGVTIKMLLNPSVKIGRLIQIDNASVQQYEYSLSTGQQAENDRIELQAKLQDDGFYYVMVAEHEGDTWGNDWYTDVICLAADVTVLPDFYKDKATVPPASVAVIKKYG